MDPSQLPTTPLQPEADAPEDADAEEIEPHFFSDPRIALEETSSHRLPFIGEATVRLPTVHGHQVWRNDLNQCFQFYHPPADQSPQLYLLMADSSDPTIPWHKRCIILPGAPLNCLVNRFAVFVQTDEFNWLVIPIQDGLFVPLRRWQFDTLTVKGNVLNCAPPKLRVHPSLPLLYWRTQEFNTVTRLKEHTLYYVMVTDDQFVWEKMLLNFPYHCSLRIAWEMEKPPNEAYPRLVARLHQPLVVMRKSGGEDSTEFMCSVYDGKFMQILADGQAEPLRVQDTTDRMQQVVAKFDLSTDRSPEAGFYFESPAFGEDTKTLEQFREAKDCEILCTFHSDVPDFYADHPLSPAKLFATVETEEERKAREDIAWQESMYQEEVERLARVQKELDEKMREAEKMEEAERRAAEELEQLNLKKQTYYVHCQGTSQNGETCVCEVCLCMDECRAAAAAAALDPLPLTLGPVSEIKTEIAETVTAQNSDTFRSDAADLSAKAANELLVASDRSEGNSESCPTTHSTNSSPIAADSDAQVVSGDAPLASNDDHAVDDTM